MSEVSQSLQEPRYRVNLKQIASGEWRGEFTIRSESEDEVMEMARSLKERIEKELISHVAV